LFRRGKRKRTRHLDVFVSASPVSRSRWGVVVPKHKQKIVRRNLVKRRLREIGRREVLPRLDAAGRDLDLLVRARPEAYQASFEELRGELTALTEELCSSG
jgi:ribonuclease P protein component